MVANPITYQFDLPAAAKPAEARIPELWYPEIKKYWKGSTSKRNVDPIFGIKAIVIHATAGGSSEGAIEVMRRKAASFHWLVPAENEPAHGNNIWACAPEARAAHHVRNACAHPDVARGRTKANHWSLGIEIVNAQVEADGFSEWQVAITAKIVRYCWAKYPNLLHVVSHAKLDPARRSDPGVRFPWDLFRELALSDEGQERNTIAALPPPRPFDFNHYCME